MLISMTKMQQIAVRIVMNTSGQERGAEIGFVGGIINATF